MPDTIIQLTCTRCGYKWTPLHKIPKCCPNCKSSYWDKERKNTPRPKCARCGETMAGRKKEMVVFSNGTIYCQWCFNAYLDKVKL